MYRVCKTYRFSASHQLTVHDGPCRALHGHNYKVQVIVSRGWLETNPEHPKYGMVIDFGDLGVAAKPLIERLDHTHLNDSLPVYPTAENVAAWIATNVAHNLHPLVNPYQTPIMEWHVLVRVHETDDSYAEYEEAMI